MKAIHVAIGLTIINLVVMIVLFTKANPAEAQTNSSSQILRGSGLELTDSKGKLRASITYHDAVQQNGVTYPAGILLRLIDSKGQPVVKIDATETGGGLAFSSASNGYIQLLADEKGGFLKIKDGNGKETIIRP